MALGSGALGVDIAHLHIIPREHARIPEEPRARIRDDPIHEGEADIEMPRQDEDGLAWGDIRAEPGVERVPLGRVVRDRDRPMHREEDHRRREDGEHDEDGMRDEVRNIFYFLAIIRHDASTPAREDDIRDEEEDEPLVRVAESVDQGDMVGECCDDRPDDSCVGECEEVGDESYRDEDIRYSFSCALKAGNDTTYDESSEWYEEYPPERPYIRDRLVAERRVLPRAGECEGREVRGQPRPDRPEGV